MKENGTDSPLYRWRGDAILPEGFDQLAPQKFSYDHAEYFCQVAKVNRKPFLVRKGLHIDSL